MTTLEAARKYIAHGFSVIPIDPLGKKPLILWKEYQSRYATDVELVSWFSTGENNIGIVTGKISGVTVVDTDTEAALKLFMEKENGAIDIPRVKTAHGYHFYYDYEEGLGNFQHRNDLPGIDLRGDGGQVVAPPSVHSSGAVYAWGPQAIVLKKLPRWLLPSTEAGQPSGEVKFSDLYHGVGKGERNMSLARLAGVWALHLSSDEVFGMAKVWNSFNTPPMADLEIITTVTSILRKESTKPKKEIVQEVFTVNDLSMRTYG